MLSAVFNVTGGEVVIIILAALVILGPEKLPVMLRRAGKLYGELRRMSDGFQSELRSALDEPTRELRDTVEMAKSQFTGVADSAKALVRPDLSDGGKATLKPADEPAAADLPDAEPFTPASVPADTRHEDLPAFTPVVLEPPALPPVRVPAAFPAPALPAPELPAPALPAPALPAPAAMNGHAAALPPPGLPAPGAMAAPLPPPDAPADAP